MRSTDGIFKSWRVGSALVFFLAAGIASADDPIRAGRYLERNVEVHEAAQIDPLLQVVDLDFDPYTPVGDAVGLALSGTGYRLAAADPGPARKLLDSRIALVHTRFERKRINSIVDAIVGTGRGFDVAVDHTGRRVVVRAQGLEEAEPDLELFAGTWLSQFFDPAGQPGRAAHEDREPGR